MKPLSDYTAAFDAEYERQSALADAIDRRADQILADKDAMLDVCDRVIAEFDPAQLSRWLAQYFVASLDHKPNWFAASWWHSDDATLRQTVYETIRTMAAEKFDADRAESERQKRQRREGSGE